MEYTVSFTVKVEEVETAQEAIYEAKSLAQAGAWDVFSVGCALAGQRKSPEVLLRQCLVALDQILTGKSINHCLRTLEGQGGKVTGFAAFDDGEYYLSDGGYSRLWVDPLNDRIFVTDNSLPRVKEAWDTPEAKRVVGELIAEFVRSRAEIAGQCQDGQHSPEWWEGQKCTRCGDAGFRYECEW